VYKFIWKWILASFVTPLVTIVSSFFVVGTTLQMIILTFWPSSIFLMSLGARENPISDVIYVWSIAVSVNVALYTIIGAVIYIIFYKRKSQSEI